jgi:phospholipid/cholesterol/gamma-HCH transport system ATP-binding protein
MMPPAQSPPVKPPETERGKKLAGANSDSAKPPNARAENARPDNAKPASSDPAVVVKGLQKSYGEQKVLNGLDLKVGSGQTVAVLGRSGTGKSVLLRLIVGLQKPDAGAIEIQGQEISNANLEEMNEIRKKMGFLFQHAALYDSLTVEENVAFPLRRHTELPADQQPGVASTLQQ